MLLLDRVLEVGDDYLVSEVVVRKDGLFDEAGRVAAFLGLEYMAQTISAFSGWQQGERVKVGYLLGTRRFTTNVGDFACGDVLRVTARRVVQDSVGMAAFDCMVEGELAMQSATLSVYEPAGRAA
jgi:predicted hotdog family 3-hydroxylacyl-ACP dehydratase